MTSNWKFWKLASKLRSDNIWEVMRFCQQMPNRRNMNRITIESDTFPVPETVWGHNLSLRCPFCLENNCSHMTSLYPSRVVFARLRRSLMTLYSPTSYRQTDDVIVKWNNHQTKSDTCVMQFVVNVCPDSKPRPVTGLWQYYISVIYSFSSTAKSSPQAASHPLP